MGLSVWSSCWKTGSSFVLVDGLARWLTTCQSSTIQSGGIRKTNCSQSQLLINLNAPTGSWDNAGQEGEKGSRIGQSISLCRGYDTGVTRQERIWHGTLPHQCDEWATLVNWQKCDEWQGRQATHWFRSGEEWQTSCSPYLQRCYCNFSWCMLVFFYSFLAWYSHTHAHTHFSLG